MTTTAVDCQASYFNRLIEDSDGLESLGHSRAFEQLVVDNMLERRVTLSIDYTAMVHHLLPNDVYDAHGYPTNFAVSGLEAELLEQPAEDKTKPNLWVLSARYNVDDDPYKLTATPDQTVISRRSIEGNELRYKLAPDMAARFMTALATGILHSRGVLSGSETPQVPPLTTAKAIDGILRSMGNLSGHYESKLTACLSMLGIDRVALVRLVEIEEPTKSEVRVDHSMTWQITGDRASELIAQQHELIDTADYDDLQQFWDRFGARQPSEVEPDQLECRMDGEQLSDEARIFYPGVNDIEYLRVNTTIMALLKPLLKPYAHLDRPLESEMPKNEDDPANLVRLDAPDEEVVLPPETPKKV